MCLCSAVQHIPGTVLPVIMVSAKSNEDNICDGLRSGSNDFVRKPYQREELLVGGCHACMPRKLRPSCRRTPPSHRFCTTVVLCFSTSAFVSSPPPLTTTTKELRCPLHKFISPPQQLFHRSLLPHHFCKLLFDCCFCSQRCSTTAPPCPLHTIGCCCLVAATAWQLAAGLFMGFLAICLGCLDVRSRLGRQSHWGYWPCDRHGAGCRLASRHSSG
jgi:CheY-like chemotaxis protein